MGSGKTTIGKRLAEPIGFDFVDTDELIEHKYGKSIPEIFSESGEAAFRRIEQEMLETLLQREYIVISTGGGMPCYHENMKVMSGKGKVVYLRTESGTLAKRLMRSRTERPLIKGKSPEELQLYIEDKLIEREPFYNQAHIVVDTENFTIEQLLQSLQLMKSK
jgi:shikimate kinase